MSLQDINQKKNVLALLIGGFAFLVMVWTTIFLFPESVKREVFVIPISIIFTLGYLFVFVKFFINPDKFFKQQEEIDRDLAKNSFGRVMLVERNAWNVDIDVLKVIFNKFQLFLPFLLSIIAIIIVIFFFISSGYDAQLFKWINSFGHNPNSSYLVFLLALLAVFFVNSILCCSIFVFSYIVLGYILRRKYLNIRENISVLLIRFFILFDFVVFISLAWVFLIFTFLVGGKEKDDFVSKIEKNSFRFFLSAFKLFLYTNIVRVSLGEEKSSFKSTYEFIKKDIYQMLRVWFGSGFLVSSILFFGMFVLVVLSKLEILSATTANKSVIAPAFFMAIISVFVFRAFAEQVGLFNVYLKDKYNIDIF